MQNNGEATQKYFRTANFYNGIGLCKRAAGRADRLNGAQFLQGGGGRTPEPAHQQARRLCNAIVSLSKLFAVK